MSEEILAELQLLTSMYESSDIHFDDPEIALKVENEIPISGSVSLTIKLNEHLKLNLRIPEGYPHTEKLSASCHISKISSSNIPSGSETLSESHINTQLTNCLKNNENNVSSDVLGLINWCNGIWDTLLTEKMSQLDLNDDPQPDAEYVPKLCRIWIHSHHIYNEKKRKFIIDTASKLDLGGFSLPGKPGFICVEGDPRNCDDFWSQVRQLTWQKISLIERHLCNLDENVFHNSFEELLIDKGAFMKYLEEKNISSVIKDYLGF